MGNALKPISVFSGGMIQSCCPATTTAADLAKPPDSAEGAAARIMQDEADAKARRAAVRYMSTVDCHYWPEAQAALINSLRADRNVCVRLEAAWALGRGCCCNKATIEALTLTVNGSDKDGNPSEDSDCVKAAAEGALAHCLAVVTIEPEMVQPIEEKPPVEKPPAERPPVDKPPTARANVFLPPYYAKLEGKPTKQVIEEARSALAAAAKRMPNPGALPLGDHSLAQILHSATAVPSGRTEVARSDPAPALQGERYVGLIPALMRSANLASPQSSALPTAETAPAAMPQLAASSVVLRQPVAVAEPSPAIAGTSSTPVEQQSAGGSRYPFVSQPQGERYGGLIPMLMQNTHHSSPPSSAVPAVEPSPATMPQLAASPVVVRQPVAVTEPPPATAGTSGAPVEQQPAGASPYPVVPQPPVYAAATRQVAVRTEAGFANGVAPGVPATLEMLSHAVNPMQREWAADNLAEANWRSNPEVVTALLKAAREDSVGLVRAACVRSLAKMHINTVPVVQTIQALKTDTDPRVRHEVEQALSRLQAEGVTSPQNEEKK
jgi:hypothetical protein